MITETERRQAADALLEAGRTREPIRQVSQTWPAMEIEDAYAIQKLWADSKVAQGARIVGHKIGLTSRAMQMASKMTEPDYGMLMDDMLYTDGARIPASSFHAPRLEVELAFVLGRPLGGKHVTIPLAPRIVQRLSRAAQNALTRLRHLRMFLSRIPRPGRRAAGAIHCAPLCSDLPVRPW